MDRAIVVDNDVTMSPPRGTVVGPDSAGINIRGFTEGNVVLNNRIRGRATAAISLNVYQKIDERIQSLNPALYYLQSHAIALATLPS